MPRTSKILLGLLVLLALGRCESFNSFGVNDADKAEAVVDETFLLVFISLGFIDPDLLPLSISPVPPILDDEPIESGLSAFNAKRASSCVAAGAFSPMGNPFTVPTPSGGTGSCEGMAERNGDELLVELDCTDYRVVGGDVTIDGIIRYRYVQPSAEVAQFFISSDDPLGLDVDGKECGGFLNYTGTQDTTMEKPFSVIGCVFLEVCGPNWQVSGSETDL